MTPFALCKTTGENGFAGGAQVERGRSAGGAHRGLPDLRRVEEYLVEEARGVVVEEVLGVSHGGKEPRLALCGKLLRSVAQARLEADRAVQ